MKKAFFILPKSPWSEGRCGPKVSQDYYQQCLVASEYYKKNKNSIVVTSSAFAFKGTSEEEIYRGILSELGVPLKMLGQGDETVSELLEAKRFTAENSYELVIITTHTHFTRVKWVCWREKIKARIVKVDGIPRPQEKWTDPIITFVYPVCDLLGLKGQFLSFVTGRRKDGKL